MEQLAQAVRAQRQPAPQPLATSPRLAYLLPIREAGRLAPLVCVHGAGGHVLNLGGLGHHLDADRPVFGLQARGLDGLTPPFSSIEEMAIAYLAEVRLLQPRGPYFLAGYCGGGIVAYEMAQRLLAAGERVALVALVDCLRPGAGLRRSRLSHLWHALTTTRVDALLPRLLAAHRRDSGALKQRLRVALARLRGAVIPYELRDLWLLNAFVRAVGRYHLRPYPGLVTVFRARDAQTEVFGVGADLGWGDLAAEVAAYEVPGGHHSLLIEPSVQALAAQLDASLRQAEASAARPLPPPTR